MIALLSVLLLLMAPHAVNAGCSIEKYVKNAGETLTCGNNCNCKFYMATDGATDVTINVHSTATALIGAYPAFYGTGLKVNAESGSNTKVICGGNYTCKNAKFTGKMDVECTQYACSNAHFDGHFKAKCIGRFSCETASCSGGASLSCPAFQSCSGSSC